MTILARPQRCLVSSIKGNTMSECLTEQNLCLREAAYTLAYTFNIAVNMCLLQHWFAP